MPSDHPTDDQIIAEEARRRRVMVAFLVSFILLIVAAGLLFFAARARVISTWLLDILVTALFLAWLGFIFFRVKPSDPAMAICDLTDESYLRKTIDKRQRHARYQLLYFLINIFGIGFLFSHVILRRAMLPPFLLGLGWLVYAIVVLLGVLLLAYGPGNDELNRAQRAQAMQLGYVFTVMEFCFLLIAAAYHPQWSLSLLPAAIATSVAVPVFYLIFLEWRAGRGDG